MTRILIAVDFSVCGRLALKAGINLAIDLGSDIRLVHAFPPQYQSPSIGGAAYHELFSKYAAENESSEAIQLSLEWADKARDQGLDVDVIAAAGPPSSLILESSKDETIAMIVIGSHGRSGFKKFVLGSVAQEVVQKSKKPTLVIPCQKGK